MRRRWRLVVVAVALIVSPALWLLVFGLTGTQGNIDPRLIGTWTVTGGPPLNMTETFTLKRNGTSVEEQIIPLAPAPMNKVTVPRFWEVDGDVLRFRSDDPRSTSMRATLWYASIQCWMLGVTRKPMPEDTWRIVSVTDDSIQLNYTGSRRWPAPKYHLTRVVAGQ
jgi:hypothetical protein